MSLARRNTWDLKPRMNSVRYKLARIIHLIDTEVSLLGGPKSRVTHVCLILCIHCRTVSNIDNIIIIYNIYLMVSTIVVLLLSLQRKLSLRISD